MSVRKFKPASYSTERRLDEAFIHAEKLSKSAKETVEQSKKVLKTSNRLLNVIKRPKP